jgi:hypothetical protein
MKGMDMMATRGVMPLGTEQANVLQTPAVANEGQNMSFAKSFGEVAVGAAGTTLAGQMLKENTAPIAKGTDAPVGMIEKLLYISVGGGLKETNSPTTTAIAKISDARVAGAQSQSSEKLGNVLRAVSVVDGNTATLQGAEVNVSAGATPVSIENSVGTIADAAGNQKAPGAKIDSMPLPSTSKVAQPVLTGNEDQPVVQKKEVVAGSAGKLDVEKTAKKELKKSSVAAANSTNVSPSVEVLGTQVATTVGAMPTVVVNTQAIDTAADSDANPGAASKVVIVGAKAVKRSLYGANSGAVETGALGVSKDGAMAAKADSGLAMTKKDEVSPSKTLASAVSVNGGNEETTHGIGGAVTASAVHGVLAVTGNVAGDGAAGKASVNVNSVATAAGQDGRSQSAASVSEGHQTLEATPTSLEVGVANGTQGWLKIRAEMTDGGVVNASVSATTSAGQEMLHRELPSLTAYLQQEQIGVGSVVLHTTATAGSQEFAEGMERDAGREQMQQRGGQEGESQQDVSGTTFSDSGEAYVQGGLSGTTNTVYAGGSWLSVRA